MLTLIFNQEPSKAVEITSFNRNTMFGENYMSSTAYCNLNGDANTIANLQSVGLDTITHLQINKDDTPIYILPNQTAHITSINETLNGEKIDVNLTIEFKFETNTEVAE